jgi:uncharacterized membrane-anchored protein YhcB (DUF1043 family)
MKVDALQRRFDRARREAQAARKKHKRLTQQFTAAQDQLVEAMQREAALCSELAATAANVGESLAQMKRRGIDEDHARAAISRRNGAEEAAPRPLAPRKRRVARLLKRRRRWAAK